MRMPSMMTGVALLAAVALWASSPGPLYAKGLDELSENKPEETPPEGDAADKAAAGEAAGEAAAPAAPVEPSATSKAMAQKLSVATSFGWVKVSRSEGDWEGSGMTDLTVGYHITNIGSQIGVAGTYRYAPIAVSGQVDDRSYRGVWDSHYFGGRFKYKASSSITAVGTAELGYVLVYLRPTDNMEQEAKHEENGAALIIGGGADWNLFDQSGGFSAGPRLNVGFGSFTTIQVSGAATFVF